MPSSLWQEYTWPDGDIDGWLWTGGLFISKDYNPETGVAFAFFAPPGGRAAIPAIAKGDPGVPFTPGDINLTLLEYNDAAPNDAEWVIVSPGDDETPAVYDLNLTLHKGEPGDDGAITLLDATDVLGDPLTGYELVYNSDADGEGNPGAIWTPPKIGGVYWPASIASTTSSDGAQRTLCNTGSIPAYPFAWRPRVWGQTIVAGTGPDVRVDLIARLNNAASGDIVARGFGLAGATPPPHQFQAGPPAGSASSYGRVNAGDTATIYMRAERQSGADSFSTSGSTTSFYVEVVPLP